MISSLPLCTASFIPRRKHPNVSKPTSPVLIHGLDFFLWGRKVPVWDSPPRPGSIFSKGQVGRRSGRLKQGPQRPSARARSFVTRDGWHGLTASNHGHVSPFSSALYIKAKSVLSPHVWAAPRIKGSSSVSLALVQHDKPMMTFLIVEVRNQPGLPPKSPPQGVEAGPFLESRDVPWFNGMSPACACAGGKERCSEETHSSVLSS